MDTSLIFQRTHAGREEIHEKRHGLTQSERLVLIMVDGVTPYANARKKLPVLRDERYARAFDTLIQKELVVEVFLPVEDQRPEAVERSVIDRYLQQDPLDPVTIIIHDVDEKFGEAGVVHYADDASAQLPSLARQVEFPPAHATSNSDAPAITASQAIMDDEHIALADSLTRVLHEQRMRGKHQAAKPSQYAVKPPVKTRRKDGLLSRSSQWPYWSIGLGIAFIAGFVVAKLPI